MINDTIQASGQDLLTLQGENFITLTPFELPENPTLSLISGLKSSIMTNNQL